MSTKTQWRNLTSKFLETTVNSIQVFDGELLNVWKDTVKLPDSNKSVREFIKHPGASVLLPIFKNGDVMLVGQYRYPLKDVFLEVPAGKLDPNESPEKTALRELREEAGLSCENLHYLGPFHPCVGYSDEVIHLFVGWGVTEDGLNSDDDEFLTRHRVHFTEVEEMIESGDITDAKTIITVLRARKWWDKNGPFGL